MNSQIQNLSKLHHLLQTNITQALPQIIPNISILSPHISPLLHFLEQSQETPKLTLAMIFFTLQNYKKAIFYFLQSEGESEKEYDQEYLMFFKQGITIRMIEYYPIIKNCQDDNKKILEEMKNYIFNRTKNDPLLFVFVMKNDNLLLKEMISEYKINLSILQKIALEENLEKEFYFVIKDLNVDGDDLKIKIDALVFFNQKKEISDLLVHSASQNLNLCYEICFYLNECYSLFLNTEEINLICKDLKFSEDAEENNFLKNNVKILLNGEFKRSLTLKLMAKNNQTDFSYLQTMIKPLTRMASTHTGIVFANAIMNLLSSNDSFHRSNTDLLNQTRHWNKFLGMACIGVIHQGNTNTLEILKNVLPSENELNEGGSLFAIGMMEYLKSESNEIITSYLLNFIESTDPKVKKSQTLLYGACFGLGLVHFGKYNNEILDKLINIFQGEHVLGSEASAFAIGMNLLGKYNENEKNEYTCSLIDKLFNIAGTTNHEKIGRAAGIAISLSMINSKKNSSITKKMLKSNNENLRYSGSFCIGSSFAGTSDLNAISILLKQINDVNEDVKRGCVISIGLVCCNNIETLFSVLEPLTVNHSASIRGAVALTLGFFMSGSMHKQCIDSVEVLMYDSDCLVRQSACIGMGFLLAQCNKKNVKNFQRIVERLNLLVVEKGENCCNAIGAAIGRSLMEGGGRNVVYGVKNLYGKIDMHKIGGAILLMQYWYSYSMLSFVSLCVMPTFYVVLNKNLEIVEDEVLVNVKKEKYDVNAIRIPDLKTRKKRRLRRRYRTSFKESEEIVAAEESSDEGSFNVISGERIRICEFEKSDLKDLGYKFV
ncbi:proteasome regulatory particle base subunit [Gurleya vavrai]